jgi:hypothetical protein
MATGQGKSTDRVLVMADYTALNESRPKIWSDITHRGVVDPVINAVTFVASHYVSFQMSYAIFRYPVVAWPWLCTTYMQRDFCARYFWSRIQEEIVCALSRGDFENVHGEQTKAIICPSCGNSRSDRLRCM